MKYFIPSFYFFKIRIIPEQRRKAVVKDWFPNGNSGQVMGKIEIFQQSEYEITNLEVEMKGLQKLYGYHVHLVKSLRQICIEQIIHVLNIGTC